MSALGRTRRGPRPALRKHGDLSQRRFRGFFLSPWPCGASASTPEGRAQHSPRKEVRGNPLSGCRRRSRRCNAARTHEHPASGQKRSRVPDCACRPRRCLDGGRGYPEAQRGRRSGLEPCLAFSSDARSAGGTVPPAGPCFSREAQRPDRAWDGQIRRARAQLLKRYRSYHLF